MHFDYFCCCSLFRWQWFDDQYLCAAARSSAHAVLTRIVCTCDHCLDQLLDYTYSAIIARYAPHCGSKCCNASINRTQGEGQILLDLRHSFFFLVKQVMICCPLISIPRTPYIILVLGSRSFDDDVGAVTTATNNAKPRLQ